jgi:probable rRNA maturation factor
MKHGQSISVNFIGDKKSQELNKQFRDKDYPTDVLSFNYEGRGVEGQDPNLLGEVFVNLEQAKRQAKDFQNTVEEEVSELSAHGILHVLGVHHEGDDH